MKNKIKVIFAILFAFTLVITPFIKQPISAQAGASKANVASVASVVDGRINTGDFMVNGGVTARDTTIVFDEECSLSSKVIGKTKIVNLKNYGVTTLLKASLSIKVVDIVEDGLFSICFGLQGLASKRQSKGVTEIRFYNDNGITFTAVEHVKEGNSNGEGAIDNVIVSPRQYSFMQNGGVVYLNVEVMTDGSLTLQLNGNTVAETVAYEGCDGYFAMFCEGATVGSDELKNVVEVGDMSIYGYSYDIPENVEYTETFENGQYNANVFYSMSTASPITPSYLTVEDGCLVFSNTAGAHLTTQYRYSNFELSFDVVDLQRVAEIDEHGNIIKLISNWFGIAFGVDTPSQLVESTLPLATVLQLEGMPSNEVTDQTVPNTNPRIVLWDKFNSQGTASMDTNIWDESYDGKIVNVKISVEDGVIKLWLKTSEEEWGAPCYTYNLGFTPYGYVRIFTWGQNSVVSNGLKYNSIANFKIDNLSIKNLDYQGVKKVTEVGFKSNVIPDTPDYDYQTKPDANDLLQNRIDGLKFESKLGWIWIVAGGVALLAIATVSTLLLMKKRRAKGE